MIQEQNFPKIENYTLIQFLGNGQYGIVYRAVNNQSQENVAIKQINLSNHALGVHKYIFNEIEVMKKFKDRNVIRFIECIRSNEQIYIVMEYCECDLHKVLKFFRGKLPERYAKQILIQLANGFSHLHQNNIIHRDIKLENILVSCLQEKYFKNLTNGNQDAINYMTVKIADFGLSKTLDQIYDTTKTRAGTLNTMAPEVIERKQYGIKADMYSLGVVIYFIIFGDYPHKIDSFTQNIDHIKRGEVQFDLNNVRISDKMQKLLKSMLEYDVDKRLEWRDLYESSLMMIDPQKNVSAIDIINNYTRLKIKQNLFCSLYNDQNIQKSQIQQIGENLVSFEIEGGDVEFITFKNPTGEFMDRVVSIKNKYGMILRAYWNLCELFKLSQIKKQSNELLDWLEVIAFEIHLNLKLSIQDEKNILQIDQTQWQYLIDSEEYEAIRIAISEDQNYFRDNINLQTQQFKDDLAFQQEYQVNIETLLCNIKSIWQNLRQNQQDIDPKIKKQVDQCFIHLLYIYRAFEKNYEYPTQENYIEFDSEDDQKNNEYIMFLATRIQETINPRKGFFNFLNQGRRIENFLQFFS